MPSGYLSLVLHAHLPYVRHPDKKDPLEQRWLYEALTETYIPLILKMRTWVHLNMDFKLTLSISSTLLSMLQDEFLMTGYSRHLNKSVELAGKERERTRGTDFESTAEFYWGRLNDVQELWKSCAGNLLYQLKEFRDRGNLEIITTASATHAYLPLVLTEEAVNAQVSAAMETFRDAFGSYPRGVWLPECAYRPRIEFQLKEYGVRYFFVDSHGIETATPKTPFGLYSPVVTDSGIAVFGRDRESGEQVWSSCNGYPGDYDYREFYRDIGFEAPLDYVANYLPDEGRTDTGFKYYRITGPTDEKEVYCREWALEKAARHADDFLSRLQVRLREVKNQLGRTPHVSAMYDAELFGHWWFEGPDFIDYLFRKIHFDQEQSDIALVTPVEYLDLYTDFPRVSLDFSSWGRDGYADVWLNGKNDWIYRALHRMERDAIELANRNPTARGLKERAINQAIRELLLAEASDFAFMMDNQTTVDYAIRRTKFHVNAFFELRDMVQNDSIDEEFLISLESKDNIFPRIDYSHYQTHREPSAVSLGRNLPTVLLLAWEYPPTVVGGLSRHVGSLAIALVRLGWQVHVITCEAPGSPYEEVQDGVHVHRCFVLRPHAEQFLDWILQMNRAMTSKINELVKSGLHFDVIHAHDWLVMTSALAAKNATDCPLVSTIHATEHGRNNGIHTPLQQRIHRQDSLLIDASDAVIVCSQYMADEVDAVFGFPRSRLNVIPNGVNLPDTTSESRTHEAASGPVILYVGRMVREKGVHTLIEAAPDILHSYPNAQFVALGKGPLLEEYRRLAEGLPFSFPGFVDDVTRDSYFRNASVCVFPSLYEPFGIVALEAMAMHVPVVVSDVGGLREVVDHERNGLTFYAGNPHSLAAQVKRVLESEALRAEVKMEAHRRICTLYNWDAIAQNTETVYRSVLTMNSHDKEEIVG